MNSIKKPIVVARKEFIDDLVKLMNESGLPAFVLEPILKDMLAETQMLMEQDYEFNLREYNEQIKNKNEEPCE